MGDIIPGSSLSLVVSPNPVVTGASLTFQSTGSSPVTLEIYDTAGRLADTRELGVLQPGSNSHYWDARDEGGSALGSGVYFVRVRSADFQSVTRVAVTRQAPGRGVGGPLHQQRPFS